MLELTVPWKERIDEAFAGKKAKYEDLVEACQEKRWKASRRRVQGLCIARQAGT
jgi:hypothetical protein